MCVREPINDPDAQLNLPVGQYTVDGEQKLSRTARARYTLGDGSDISVFSANKSFSEDDLKIKNSATLTDPARMYQVLSDTMDSIGETKFEVAARSRYPPCMVYRDISQNNIEFYHYPTTDRGDGATVSMERCGSEKMFNTIIQDRNLSATPSPHLPQTATVNYLPLARILTIRTVTALNLPAIPPINETVRR